LITPAKVSHKSVQRTADKIGAFAGVLGRTVVEKIAAVVEAAEREREDISAGIAQPANTRPTAIATSAMIASSNSFSAIE
jgi:hypothetical protein